MNVTGLDPNFGIQLGSLPDPLQHLHRQKSETPSTGNYNPSVYADSGKRGGGELLLLLLLLLIVSVLLLIS